MLEPQQRSLWSRIQERDKVDEIQVSWGMQAKSWDDRSPLDLKGSPNCPQESFCRSRDPETGRCQEEVAAGSSAWQERFGCFADARLTKFGAEYQVFETDLPANASDATIMAFFREGADLVPWFTRSEKGNDRVPGQLRLQLFGSNDFDLDLQVKLLMSPGGFVQDLQIGQCQVVNRDDASMERRILSQDRQYCHVEETRF